MKMLRTGMEIEFRPPSWGKYKNRYRPLMKGFIVDDFYTPDGHTHIFRIRTNKGIISMNGAVLYADAKILGMNLEEVIKGIMKKESASGFNKITFV